MSKLVGFKGLYGYNIITEPFVVYPETNSFGKLSAGNGATPHSPSKSPLTSLHGVSVKRK